MSQRWHSHISEQDWEALCDGCGQCCMHKFEDEDTGEILNTDVACALFDSELCRCKQYDTRFEVVPSCLAIRKMSDEEMNWLPPTCAYRLKFEGKELFDWHPLNSGNIKSVWNAGVSMHGKCVSELGVSEESLVEHVIEPITL